MMKLLPIPVSTGMETHSRKEGESTGRDNEHFSRILRLQLLLCGSRKVAPGPQLAPALSEFLLGKELCLGQILLGKLESVSECSKARVSLCLLFPPTHRAASLAGVFVLQKRRSGTASEAQKIQRRLGLQGGGR